MFRMLVLACAILAVVPLSARAQVTRFQNGSAPTAEYKGCVDTRISIYNDREATRGAGKASVLATYSTARRALVRFDLSALPKGHVVRRALLRLHCSSSTRFGSSMYAAPLTRAWDDSATGFEHKKTDDNKSPAGNWTKKGGDYDDKSVAQTPVKGGPVGHVFEFDVTAIAADWVAGKRANYGLIFWSSKYAVHNITSSEWWSAAYRPELIIDHAPAAGAPELQPLPARAKTIALSDVAKTADLGKAAGAYSSVCLGLNAASQVREGVADAYVKSRSSMAGRWGWMPALRVGGAAGDFNAALLKFDLSALPKGASIKSARLRMAVAGSGGGVRFGAYLKKDGARKWDAGTVTWAEASDGVAWGKGGVRDMFEELPAAVAMCPGRKRKQTGPLWIEWDLTGAARARAGKVLDLAVLHDIDGGLLDVHSSKYHDASLRPMLTIEVSPAPKLRELKPLTPLAAPSGDYWVAPMKKAHARFKGKVGTLAQYGDSITITMAFLATHSYGASCIPAKCSEADKKHIKLVDQYANRKLWRAWKGPKWGNNGSMTSNWCRANVDKWQKTCNPEVMVMMFGTNDVSYGPVPPTYTENLAYAVKRCLADGTIPILTTASPRGDQKKSARVLQRVQANHRAVLAIARGMKVPLIDFYQEIMTRQPEKWDKTLMGDSLHPSYRNPWKKDFTPEGLKNSGYTLRNYLTFMMYADIIEKVLLPAKK
jgi:GDSL-like lipase/acylhydrolase family protein